MGKTVKNQAKTDGSNRFVVLIHVRIGYIRIENEHFTRKRLTKYIIPPLFF
jgi:hypothetical protein